MGWLALAALCTDDIGVVAVAVTVQSLNVHLIAPR